MTNSMQIYLKDRALLLLNKSRNFKNYIQNNSKIFNYNHKMNSRKANKERKKFLERIHMEKKLMKRKFLTAILKPKGKNN